MSPLSLATASSITYFGKMFKGRGDRIGTCGIITGSLLCAFYTGGDNMGVILGWIVFGLAVLRLVSIMLHAIYNAIAKDNTSANPGDDNILSN